MHIEGPIGAEVSGGVQEGNVLRCSDGKFKLWLANRSDVDYQVHITMTGAPDADHEDPYLELVAVRLPRQSLIELPCSMERKDGALGAMFIENPFAMYSYSLGSSEKAPLPGVDQLKKIKVEDIEEVEIFDMYEVTDSAPKYEWTLKMG